jgi:hypothetical protein
VDFLLEKFAELMPDRMEADGGDAFSFFPVRLRPHWRTQFNGGEPNERN